MSTGSQGPQGPVWNFGEAAEGPQRVSPILILLLGGSVSSDKWLHFHICEWYKCWEGFGG